MYVRSGSIYAVYELGSVWSYTDSHDINNIVVVVWVMGVYRL